VVPRGVPPLDVVELRLLVDVDEDATLDGFEQPRSRDLERLEDDVAIGEDDRRSERPHVLERLERTGEEPVRERVVHEVGRDGEQVWLAGMFHAVALERSQVVRVPELGAKLLEYLPVLLLPPVPDLLREVAFQVLGNPGVVDHEEEDYAPHVNGSPAQLRRATGRDRTPRPRDEPRSRVSGVTLASREASSTAV